MSTSLDVRNPGRISELVGQVPIADAAGLDAIVTAAHRAQREWWELGVDGRGARLTAAADAIDSGLPRLAQLLAREVGTILSAATGELRVAATMYRHMAEHARSVIVPTDYRDPDGLVRVLRRPHGVVACIVPWNAPAVLAAQKTAPALAAGNAVIVKPSPYAPLTVTAMFELVAAELPPGLVTVLNGEGEVGGALIAHPGIAKISFTGGGATARSIMRTAADRLTAIHFELGGNDPAIVLDDVDAGVAAAGIVGSAFRRAGQICYAVKRVYVPETRLAEMRDAIVDCVSALAIGDALDPATTMGPVNNRLQFDRMRELREHAVAAGRRVVTLGSRLDESSWESGYYVQPSVVLDAQQGDELVGVEQFGPLLPIVGYRTQQDALAMANDGEFGLGASVWSADPERALGVAERIESGVSFVNAHVSSPLAVKQMPFGGIKQSGMGWENGTPGLEEYLQFHSVDVHGPVRS